MSLFIAYPLIAHIQCQRLQLHGKAWRLMLVVHCKGQGSEHLHFERIHTVRTYSSHRTRASIQTARIRIRPQIA